MKQTKTETNDTRLPAPESTQEAVKILTPVQQQVSGYVTSAKKDPPRVSDFKELFTRIEMEIPKGVSRGSEFDYAWLSIADLHSIHGSKWEIVNRNNHSHAPDRLFDATGGILYKGQNILAFCYREAREIEQAAIVKHYNDKTEKITHTQDRAIEGEVSRIDLKTAGGLVQDASINELAEARGFAPEVDDF